jgi:hypothetical protein
MLLVDTNRNNVSQARLAGLEARNVSALAEEAFESLDLNGIKAMLALTPNDEVNALAALRCSHIFGRSNTYQLTSKHGEEHRLESVNQDFHARTFGTEEHITYSKISYGFAEGSSFKLTLLTEQFSYDDFLAQKGEGCFPLFTLSKSGTLTILSPKSEKPEAGVELLALVPPETNSPSTEAQNPAPKPQS